jgi:hypothetical protein
MIGRWLRRGFMECSDKCPILTLASRPQLTFATTCIQAAIGCGLASIVGITAAARSVAPAFMNHSHTAIDSLILIYE